MSESRVTYEYDGTGRLASAAYPDGTVVRYSGEAGAPARASAGDAVAAAPVVATPVTVAPASPIAAPAAPPNAGVAVFCTQCGAKLAPDAAFCTKCGTRVE